MNSQAQVDLLIRGPNGQPLAAVEVKNRQELSRDIATMLRSNIVARGLLPQVPYFLILSQDKGFLWKEPQHDGLELPPKYEFPMSGVVTRYLPGATSEERLRGSELELLVLQWLLDLTSATQPPNDEPEKVLALSGFLDSIRGATVVIELDL